VNPNFRLAALIAASLGLVVSLFIALSPGDDDGPAPATTGAGSTVPATTEAGPTTEAAPPEPAPVTIRLEVAADAVPDVRRLSVQRGRDVELVVSSALTDHVHVHGYDLTADVGPGLPGRLAFTADAAGRFEIELEERGLQLADLEVRP
jgi:hypothetical protein